MDETDHAPETTPYAILLVDDDPSVRKVLTLALTRRGYEVVAAVDGGEALRCLRERDFDLLITDIHMPEVDGLELAKVSMSIRPGMGVILMTGFGTEESVITAFRQGAAAYIKKPIQLSLLYRTIRLVAESLEDLPPESATVEFGAGPEEALAMLGLERDDRGWVNLVAPSHRAFLDRFTNMCELLLARGLDSDTIDELRVAILELGSNAIEWGHRSSEEFPLKLSARLYADRIVVVVEDCGEGFRPDNVPDPTADARAIQRHRQSEGKRPGGYGIALVRAITDHLIYNERGNVVAMVKKLKARPAAG